MAWSRFERLTVIGLAGFVLGLWLAGCARGFSRGPWDGGTDGWESFDSSADDEGGRPVCGNGVVEDGEECDDGNSVDGDGCSASCELEASCGPESCPNGCCDAQGRCLSGNGDSSCGTGGAACRDCAASGLICLQGTCQRPGDCNPGDTAPCDRCGYRQCQADGTWGPCQDQGECEPNTSQVQGNCQRCGTLVRICNSNCEWEPTQCMNQGDCEPGDVQQGGGCERCGHEERTCQSNCTWGPTRCVGQGECDPGTHRDCGDCGRQDCSSSCTYGSCYAYYSCPSGQTCDSSGQCVNACGDGQCDAGEDCASCPEDCGPPGHLGTGAHGDPCPNVPDNTWRCVLVHYQWGDDWTSQVCRNGSWVNYNEAPRDCPHCCWDYSTACNQ